MDVDPVAITSISAQCAGAANVDEYWRLLRAARPQFSTVPDNRWTARTTPRLPGRDNKTYSHTMAALSDPFAFDATRFRIPKARVQRMDPQQRVAITLVDELFTRKTSNGHLPDTGRVATIIGVSSTDYRSISSAPLISELLVDGTLGLGDTTERELLRDAASRAVQPMTAHTVPGVLANMVPAVVQSTFNLTGPALSVDSACASGLTAVELACSLLHLKRVRACIAGGVYTALTPEAHVGFSAIGALSRTGECRPFTSAANGFVIGEGGAMLLLKRLSDARDDGDSILAVITALGSSNDGRAEGSMTPTVTGQVRAIQETAHATEGTSLEVDAVEGHGTGTVVGDTTELETLKQAYIKRVADHPIQLGSAKAVIGHTMAASGALALVKATLALAHNHWPKQPHDDQAVAHPRLESTNLRLADETVPRPETLGRVAVNSFGFGGTNAHAVLEGNKEMSTYE